ncbi:MAG TPA: branched-chain amino acid ABC transporter permease [Gaiellaceae bacterium]|jgi:branched-chain amino acid transport system permease protein|nr:branched-chain amino acid ABC transporter permease [Gaiellaceae bacterium]HEX4747091.1 branched-chain amino acid ABC transporter permease [Gaiellaceae bacterium]
MSEGPRIGQDEWVARSGENIRRNRLEQALDRVPGWARLLLFAVVVASIPLLTDDGYVNAVVFDTLIFCLLAIGLNVAVGWGGLLDLGYIAFFGFGAYTYAILSSEKFDLHVSSLVVMAICVVTGALLGLLVGLPSWRLSGDYLAIVTLFAYQIFISIVTNGHDLFGVDLTGGVNGISNLDPFDVFGREIVVSKNGIFNSNYVYVALGLFLVVFTALYLVNHSRIGRAWRALREDTLAAELMGMPTEWLKLLAFAFGAAVAALTGSLFASLKVGVFPETFSLTLLITVYAMLILGGVGSQTGAVLGAVIVYVFLEALRDPDVSGWVFYLVILLAVILVLRPRWMAAVVLAGTLVFGFVVHAVAGAIDDSWTTSAPLEADSVSRFLDAWVVLPASPGDSKTIAYIGLVALVLLATTVKGLWRAAVVVPTLYLAAFVWENVLSTEPDVTRFVLLGAMLVAVMVTRPAGILGERRVEIV